MLYDVRLTAAQMSSLAQWYIEGESMTDVLLRWTSPRDGGTVVAQQGDTTIQLLSDGTILPHPG
jgi:hypothetical protein